MLKTVHRYSFHIGLLKTTHDPAESCVFGFGWIHLDAKGSITLFLVLMPHANETAALKVELFLLTF